jgi:hypothetical protein
MANPYMLMKVTDSFRPTGFYWRQAIRTCSPEALQKIALALVTELEVHKEYIRELGHIPPKMLVHPSEAAEKGWSFGDGRDPRIETGPDGRERSVLEEVY